MTLFNPHCSLETLKSVTGLENFEDLFLKLRGSSLVETYDGGRFGLQELVKQYASGLLEPHESVLLPRFREYFYGVVVAKGWALQPHMHKEKLAKMMGETKGLPEEFKGEGGLALFTDILYQQTMTEFELERQNILLAFELLMEDGDGEKLKGFLDGVTAYFQIKAYWADYIRLAEKALAFFEEKGDEKYQSALLNNLGVFYGTLGEWDKTLEYCGKDLEISKKLGDEHGMAQTWANIANIQHAKGHKEEAVKTVKKALEVFERLGDRLSAETVRENLKIFKSSDE